MSQTEATKLVGLLGDAKQVMIHMSGHYAEVTGEWDRAQCYLQWARVLDEMLQDLGPNGASSAKLPQSQMRPPKPVKLPHYFIHDDKLVKVGPSRDGTTYEHRVVHRNFDLVVQRLIGMAQIGSPFETPELVNRCDIPKHEPLIVLAVLEENGLLVKVRRGRWVFKNASTFAGDVQRVWSALPGQ